MNWSKSSQPYIIMGMRADYVATFFLLFVLFIFTRTLVTSSFLLIFIACLFFSKKKAIPVMQIPQFVFSTYVLGKERKCSHITDMRSYPTAKDRKKGIVVDE